MIRPYLYSLSGPQWPLIGRTCVFYMRVIVMVLQVQVSYCPDMPYRYQKHKNKLKKKLQLRAFSANYKVSSNLQVDASYAETAE